MARCYFCDKSLSFGIKLSHSHRRSNRTFKPNLKRVKAIVENRSQHIKVCTRCLRSGKVKRAWKNLNFVRCVKKPHKIFLHGLKWDAY